MAISHIKIDPQFPAASRLRSLLLRVDQNNNELAAEVLTMATFIDGDSSDAANYTAMAVEYGVAGVDQPTRNANAKALFDETGSLAFKLTTDAAVDHVNTAIRQAANKVR